MIVTRGPRITAEVDVVVDAARVDPDSVRVVTAFPPYRILGGGLRSRTASGGTVIRFSAIKPPSLEAQLGVG